MIDLSGTPYLLDSEAERELTTKVRELEERVALLRKSGALTAETLENYYGAKKFEQVAESNAIEGSTLSVGETELAVLKGITTTGHDPAYIRDAIALEKALVELAQMARVKEPTDITQLLKLHELIMGDRPGGGVFRTEPVRIKGSPHKPPVTWKEVMDNMEEWEAWSKAHDYLPAVNGH